MLNVIQNFNVYPTKGNLFKGIVTREADKSMRRELRPVIAAYYNLLQIPIHFAISDDQSVYCLQSMMITASYTVLAPTTSRVRMTCRRLTSSVSSD